MKNNLIELEVELKVLIPVAGDFRSIERKINQNSYYKENQDSKRNTSKIIYLVNCVKHLSTS